MADTATLAPGTRIDTRARRVEESAVFVGGALAVGLLAAAKGGYFPSTWSWATALLGAAAAAGLLLGRTRAVGIISPSYVAGLAALGAWQLLSLAWSSSGRPVFEAERTLVYVSGVAAALAIVRRPTLHHFLGGVLAGIVAVDLYALGTRLLPDRLPTSTAFAGNRLSAPVGYWNGLGMVSVLALLLALGFATRARSTVGRVAGALALPFAAVTIYFTYSRGSWIVLGLALVVVLAVAPRRLQLVTASVAALPAGAAVWLAWRAHALGRVGGSAAAATHEGHRLALVVCALAVLGGATAAAIRLLEERVSTPKGLRRAYAVLLICLAVAGLAAVLAAGGGPATVVRRGWHSFTAPPAPLGAGAQESGRLFSLSSNGRIELWQAAWGEARTHPVLGGGAGSFEAWWLAHRESTQHVRDAHSLYLQTLGEVGAIGLALLAAALVLPLVAAVRARRSALMPFAVAGYVAFLVHAAGDWDWQLPGVTLPALLLGAALVIATRDEQPESVRRWFAAPALAAAAAVVAIGLLTALGNVPLTRASAAVTENRWTTAVSEASRAVRWLPWSGEPWRLRGEAELAARRRGAAIRDLTRAAAKEPDDWQVWFDLGAARTGAARQEALARAARLNPRSPELAGLSGG